MLYSILSKQFFVANTSTSFVVFFCLFYVGDEFFMGIGTWTLDASQYCQYFYQSLLTFSLCGEDLNFISKRNQVVCRNIGVLRSYVHF